MELKNRWEPPQSERPDIEVEQEVDRARERESDGEDRHLAAVKAGDSRQGKDGDATDEKTEITDPVL